jgi:ABC-type dipeptide/oligopeptide/nickel transport system permease component
MMAMIFLRRLVHALPTMAGVIVAIFVLLRVVPGDPIAMLIPAEATPTDVAHLRAFYGLDKPIFDQFVLYLKNLSHGDFGISISLKQGVLRLVLDRLPATLELAILAGLIAITLGSAIAIVSTYTRMRGLVLLLEGFNSIALAVPEFLWGLLLILLFGVLLPVLPISGRIDPSSTAHFATGFSLVESFVTGRFAVAGDLIAHMILPAMTLALPFIAIVARVLRSALISAMTQDYVSYARVHGFGRLRILLSYALPNALLPTVTVAGAHFVLLVGGTVLVELIFAYPGIGNMLYGAAVNRDLPLIQGVTIIFALLFIGFNLAVDLAYLAIDPRVKY